jgi:hypothetical protein
MLTGKISEDPHIQGSPGFKNSHLPTSTNNQKASFRTMRHRCMCTMADQEKTPLKQASLALATMPFNPYACAFATALESMSKQVTSAPISQMLGQVP